MESQHVEVSSHGDLLVLTVRDSRLTDEQQARAWQQQMTDAIAGASAAGVIVDMKNVDYMTSVGVFPLVAARNVAERSGGRLVLCNLSETVAKVLTVTQLIVESRDHAKHLVACESFEDAVGQLQS